MYSDMYMIFLTALAVFGLYSIVERIITDIRLMHMPQTITVFGVDGKIPDKSHIEYMESILCNNRIIVVSDEEVMCPLVYTVTKDNLPKFITNDLFTKN